MKRISVLRDGVGRLDLHPPAVAAGDSVSKPWAWQALENYEPKDVPESEKQQWDEEVDVRCPSCRSKDIQFEGIGGDREWRAAEIQVDVQRVRPRMAG
jgi:hypothetical protein